MFTAKIRSVKLCQLRTVEISLEVPWSHEIPIRLPERIFALVEGREVSAATCHCDVGEWDVRLEGIDGEGVDLAHVKVCKVALKDDDGEVVARVTLAAEVCGSDLEWLHGAIGAQREVGMVQRQEGLPGLDALVEKLVEKHGPERSAMVAGMVLEHGPERVSAALDVIEAQKRLHETPKPERRGKTL